MLQSLWRKDSYSLPRPMAFAFVCRGELSQPALPFPLHTRESEVSFQATMESMFNIKSRFKYHGSDFTGE